MGSSRVRLYGGTSGFVELAAPDVAPDGALVLPDVAGTLATEGFVGSAIAAIPGIGSNVVQAVKTDPFTMNSATFTPITGLSVTITPFSTSSKILIIVSLAVNLRRTSSFEAAYWRVMRGSTPVSVGDADGVRARATKSFGAQDQNQLFGETSALFVDAPETDTATTYSVEIARAIETIAINTSFSDSNSVPHARTTSSIIAIEVAA